MKTIVKTLMAVSLGVIASSILSLIFSFEALPAGALLGCCCSITTITYFALNRIGTNMVITNCIVCAEILGLNAILAYSYFTVPTSEGADEMVAFIAREANVAFLVSYIFSIWIDRSDTIHGSGITSGVKGHVTPDENG